MVMTRADLQQHAENLRTTLHRKIRDLWDCNCPEGRTVLLVQTKALRNRINELDQQIMGMGPEATEGRR